MESYKFFQYIRNFKNDSKVASRKLVLGNLKNKILPFALLQNNHARHINGAIKNLHMMKAFMKVAQRFPIKEEYSEEYKDKRDINYVQLLWEKVCIIYLNTKFNSKNCTVDVAQKTMHNCMLQKKVF